jgi:hypothetical protein
LISTNFVHVRGDEPSTTNVAEVKALVEIDLPTVPFKCLLEEYNELLHLEDGRGLSERFGPTPTTKQRQVDRKTEAG